MGKYIYQKKQTMNRIYRLALQLAPVFLVVHMSGVVLVYGKKARKGHCGPKGIKRKRCKPKNKGSSKGGKVTYEGTVTMDPYPTGLDYYPNDMSIIIVGTWTSEPINAKNTVSLCDCDGNDIVPGDMDGVLSFELGDKSEGTIGTLGLIIMQNIPCATVKLKDEAGMIYASSSEFQIGPPPSNLKDESN